MVQALAFGEPKRLPQELKKLYPTTVEPVNGEAAPREPIPGVGGSPGDGEFVKQWWKRPHQA